MQKKFTRVFFATDVHGSEQCFRKFLGAAKFYKADVLVLGGDITGKLVIPIVDLGNGTYRADVAGREETAHTSEELGRLEKIIADSGYYSYRCDQDEMNDLKSSKEKIDHVFTQVMRETLIRWVEYGEQVLHETNTMCYVTGGNDDLQEVLDGFTDTAHMKNVDGKIVKIDPSHEMANMGWSNPTPWHCPRECIEDELEERIEKLVGSISDLNNCIFNFHTPPKDCGLDTVQKLDESVDPPRPYFEGGQPVLFGAGSKAVRAAVEKYKPLADLCGHVHESHGVCNIGRTLVVNPGSEYSEGVLRGALVNISEKKIVSWQLTSG
jgi:Icc-related predicted phosphoesterase